MQCTQRSLCGRLLQQFSIVSNVIGNCSDFFSNMFHDWSITFQSIRCQNKTNRDTVCLLVATLTVQPSDAKLKPNATRFPALQAVCLFSLVIAAFTSIVHCDNFGSGFTVFDRNSLWLYLRE